MSRPAPTIIDSYQTPEVEIQILQSDGVWAVFREGKPFNIRRVYNAEPSNFQYSRAVFPTKGHAVVLANKLNTLSATPIYEVVNLLQENK